jgi:diguanylate cyclase (GGDEF)-like protein
MAGRIGGEEFVLALPGCSANAALVTARRIRIAFQEEARFVNGKSVSATVSVGVAAAPEHGFSLVDIISSADNALYRAKIQGRNRVMLAAHNPPDPDSVIRIA